MSSASSSTSDETVTLVSAEGEKFIVPKKVAEMSQLVFMMTEDQEVKQDVPLSDVKSTVLAKVIEFCKQHVDTKLPEIEKPLKSTDLAEIVPKWDADFVNIEQETLFELILAANYMDIKSLLDLTCAKVASMIKGKTPEQIRQTFNIRKDFTEEEEKQIIDENKWCEEV
jgi:S-phase kinase-associated protein 1